jgi:hypothetical protein
LQKEELHNAYSSPNIITEIIERSMRWAGHVSCIGEKTNADNNLAETPVRNRKFRGPRNTFEKSFRMDLKEIEHEDVEWILLV